MIPLDDRRYSQHARRSLVWARLIAQEYYHPFVDTDHVLLGIWRTENSIGYRAIAEFDVTRTEAENIVQALHPQLESPLDPAPFSSELQAILKYAADEAYWLGSHYIGTEHILLGLVRAGTGHLSRLLLELQISSHQMRQGIRRLLSEGVYESTLEAVRRSARLSELSRRVLNAAETLARKHQHKAAGLEHLLLVLARERRSMATRLLLQNGFDETVLADDIAHMQLDVMLAATGVDEVLAKAVQQAEQLGTHYTGTDHILLGMTLDEEAVILMQRYNVDVARLREQLQENFQR